MYKRRTRVVITGMGVLAPNGTGLEAFWQSILDGRSGIGPITLFDTTGYKSRIAGEVKGFNVLDYIPRSEKPRRLARNTQMAFAATRDALADAQLDLGAERDSPANPVPVVLGVGTSAMDILQVGFDSLRDHGPASIKPFAVGACAPQAAASFVGKMLGVPTRAFTLSSTCVGGLDAIATAATLIRTGESDIAIAGGADAPITPLAIASFTTAGLSSIRNNDPARASRPFDRNRDSGVISEGAAVLVLENLDHAIARGAKPYLEMTGYGSQSDPDPDAPGGGLENTMSAALANADCLPADIDYICAYGPGHPIFDEIELSMIKRVFGKHAASVPISSIKGVTGNPLAAAGPMQLVSSALSLTHNLIPPTANCEDLDDGCDLDVVMAKSRRVKLNRILINVRGLGGGSCSLIVERLSR
ncbi:MAG TPA: beta-ketoacyl-[acyl-carrier-protein] synthase family protein [Chthoniobacterales bacterium]|nr:beta-ketoacyl-[acyl-carrier-protein] synthase family protein [Chthoniobacterales bacterium]